MTTNAFTSVDYVAEAKDRYTEKFKNDPVYDAYVRLITKYLNELQSTYKNVMQARSLETASGKQLDQIGAIVGQPRVLLDFEAFPFFGFEGASSAETFGSSSDSTVGGYFRGSDQISGAPSSVDDDTYRFLIKARIVANTTRCTPQEIIDGLNYICSSNECGIVELGNANIILEVPYTLTSFQKYFIEGISNIGSIVPIPAGVKAGISYVGDSPWHGYVTSLMRMSSADDDVSANTWEDVNGFIYNNALRPDGTGQQGIFCTPGTLSDFDLSSGDFTIEFFYTPSAYDNTYPENRGIMSFGGGYTYNTTFFLRYIGGAGFQFYVYPSPGNPQFAATSAPALTTGVEHHIAIQRKSGVYSIFVNGLDATYQRFSVSPMAPSSGDKFSLGQIYTGGYSEQMTGSIRQFRWTRLALYNAPFSRPGSFPATI